MIKLYQFASVWDIQNLGSFWAKIETVLRIVGVRHEILNSLPVKAAKGNPPFIEDGGVKVTDSRFIHNHLPRTHGIDRYRDLDADQKTVSTPFQRLTEEDLCWAMYMCEKRT